MVDFGLIPSDNDKQKKIGPHTYGDVGEVEKKPSNKNRLKPSYIIIIMFAILCLFGFEWYQNNFLYPKQTKSELLEIRNALYHYKESFDVYPNELTELAKGRPLREIWLTDAWDNPYQYEADESKQTFIVISGGNDGKFGTDDDIQIE
jgi:hypothetical protein